jgi:hypothetical protein
VPAVASLPGILTVDDEENERNTRYHGRQAGDWEREILVGRIFS